MRQLPARLDVAQQKVRFWGSSRHCPRALHMSLRDPELTRAPYGPWELGQYGAQTAVKTLQAKIYDP